MFAPKVNKLAANFTFGIPSFDISKILFTFVVNHPNWFKQMQTLLKQMKYLRSLMQQFVTACKNQAKLIQQFTLSLLYLFIIHIVALLFFLPVPACPVHLNRLSVSSRYTKQLSHASHCIYKRAMVWQCYSLLHIAVTISHFMDNRSLQLSLQVGIQIYLYLFHSILFTVVHYFGSQHPLFLLFF